MPKHFNTIKRYLTNEEKCDRAEYFNEFCEGFETVDVEAFVKKDIFDESIVLKCLNCGFQEEVDYDIISEMWNEFESDYPESYCMKCNKPDVVPLDVYNRIKGLK
jgi:RNase P subunit RPR2